MLTPDQRAPGAVIATSAEDMQEVKPVDAKSQGVEQAMAFIKAVVDDEVNAFYEKGLLGVSDAGASGFSIVTKAKHAEASFIEPTRAIANFILMGVEETFQQWRDKFPGHALAYGGERYTIKMFPKEDTLRVEVAPDMPEDTVSAYNTAQIGLAAGIIDMDVAREMVGLDNPKGVQDRVDAYAIHMSPQLQGERILRGYWDRRDALLEEAASEPDEVKKGRLLREANRIQEFATTAEAQLGIAARQGIGAPPPKVGVRPEAGGTSDGMADEKAIAEGRPNAFMGGRPRTGGGNGATPALTGGA